MYEPMENIQHGMPQHVRTLIYVIKIKQVDTGNQFLCKASTRNNLSFHMMLHLQD